LPAETLPWRTPAVRADPDDDGVVVPATVEEAAVANQARRGGRLAEATATLWSRCLQGRAGRSRLLAD